MTLPSGSITFLMTDIERSSAMWEADSDAMAASLALHDELMQYVLGLSHLVAILFFTTLARSGRSYGDLSQVASTTYLKEARTAAEVARESPGLYYEIQRLNRHSGELFALVRSCLAEIERAALADDSTAFSELMRAGRTFFPESLPAELG